MDSERDVAFAYFKKELGLFVSEFFKLLLGMFLIGLSFTLLFEWHQLEVDKNSALWHHPLFASFLAYSALMIAGSRSVVRLRNKKREA